MRSHFASFYETLVFWRGGIGWLWRYAVSMAQVPQSRVALTYQKHTYRLATNLRGTWNACWRDRDHREHLSFFLWKLSEQCLCFHRSNPSLFVKVNWYLPGRTFMKWNYSKGNFLSSYDCLCCLHFCNVLKAVCDVISWNEPFQIIRVALPVMSWRARISED